MQDKVTIYCINNHQYYDVPRGTSLREVYDQIHLSLPYQLVAARVNYKIQALSYVVYNPKDVEFLDISCANGMGCYVRTLFMVMSYAISEIYPHLSLRVEHPISNGYYCTLQGIDDRIAVEVTDEMISTIKGHIQEIIDQDLPIILEEKRTEEVIALFKNRSGVETTLFETLGDPYCRYFRIGDYIDYYSGVLTPSTGYLKIFDLIPFHEGMLLRIPKRTHPVELADFVQQDKMFGIFKEYVNWNKLLHISNVGEFNNVWKKKKSFELIKVSEALHEKKIAQIADMIANNPRGEMPRFILISGPSSSGKTTFSKRLSVQLAVNAIQPKVISMDNYFVNRDETPKDENGKYDFESVYALDIPLFQQQLNELLEGKEVKLPTYNFELGRREYRGNTMKLEKDTVLIMEGLHALNPILTPNIPTNKVFKIFVSCLTTINLDDHNWVPTTDVRLLRRLIRDYRYRGFSPQSVIANCPSVTRGEEKWVFPFQEEADVMFNSALLFELAVLKRHVEPILSEVPKACEEYTDAHRLLKFLHYFEAISEKEVPPTSFLREFVGGSSFVY